jgi:hypothetical protein
MMRTRISRQKSVGGSGLANGHRSLASLPGANTVRCAGLGWFPPYGRALGSEALGAARARPKRATPTTQALTGCKPESLGRVNFAPEGMTFRHSHP